MKKAFLLWLIFICGSSVLFSQKLFRVQLPLKDKTYAHEEEYRLLFVDTIQKEKKYIKTSSKDSICEGIYIETEPVLFQDDKDIIYFGPKVPAVTIDKYRHAFRLSGLPFNGSTEKMLQPSRINYR